MAFKNA